MLGFKGQDNEGPDEVELGESPEDDDQIVIEEQVIRDEILSDRMWMRSYVEIKLVFLIFVKNKSFILASWLIRV